MTLGGGEDVSQRKKILAEKLAKVLYAKYVHLVRRFPCYSCSISGKKNLKGTHLLQEIIFEML